MSLSFLLRLASFTTFARNLNDDPINAVSVAALKGHTEIGKLLLEKGANGKVDALIIGAMRGNRELVGDLLNSGGLNQRILDRALAQTDEREISELLKKAGAISMEQKQLRPELNVDEGTLQKYAGSYRLDEARQFTFFVRNGKLDGWDVRQYSFPITAVDKNVFRIGNDDSRTITFNEENGKIVGITVAQPGSKQTYNRVEGK